MQLIPLERAVGGTLVTAITPAITRQANRILRLEQGRLVEA